MGASAGSCYLILLLRKMTIYIFTYLALLATGLTISAGLSHTSSQQMECIVISTTAAQAEGEPICVNRNRSG